MNPELVAEPTYDEEPQPPIFKDEQGRFIQGNKGGPGNPFGRQVALLRSVVLQASTEERMAELIEMLWKMALDGNLAAVKLILQYTLGKPGRAVEPDRVEIDDWNIKKESAVAPADLVATPLKVMAERSNRLCELMWPTLEVETLRPFKESLQAEAKEHEQTRAAKATREARRAAEKAARAAETSTAPSPNGFFEALSESEWRELIQPSMTAPSVVNASIAER